MIYNAPPFPDFTGLDLFDYKLNLQFPTTRLDLRAIVLNQSHSKLAKFGADPTAKTEITEFHCKTIFRITNRAQIFFSFFTSKKQKFIKF